jgi:hypothetical protein
MLIEQTSQESHGLVKTGAIDGGGLDRGNNANTSAERRRWFEIESNCRYSAIADFSDTGEMGDRHAMAREAVGDDKVVAFNGYPLDWPRPYQPVTYEYATQKDDTCICPLPRRIAQSAVNPHSQPWQKECR